MSSLSALELARQINEDYDRAAALLDESEAAGEPFFVSRRDSDDGGSQIEGKANIVSPPPAPVRPLSGPARNSFVDCLLLLQQLFCVIRAPFSALKRFVSLYLPSDCCGWRSRVCCRKDQSGRVRPIDRWAITAWICLFMTAVWFYELLLGYYRYYYVRKLYIETDVEADTKREYYQTAYERVNQANQASSDIVEGLLAELLAAATHRPIRLLVRWGFHLGVIAGMIGYGWDFYHKLRVYLGGAGVVTVGGYFYSPAVQAVATYFPWPILALFGSGAFTGALVVMFMRFLFCCQREVADGEDCRVCTTASAAPVVDDPANTTTTAEVTTTTLPVTPRKPVTSHKLPMSAGKAFAKAMGGFLYEISGSNGDSGPRQDNVRAN